MTVLADFFKEDSVFIAYGPEKYSMDDFDLDNDGEYQELLLSIDAFIATIDEL